MTDRIEQIKDLIAQRGEDTFLVYSLGMELASAGRLDEAQRQFRRCLELDADYLPGYSELGKVMRSAGRLGEAKEVFAAGIALAERTGQSHMRDYLRQQLDSLPR